MSSLIKLTPKTGVAIAFILNVMVFSAASKVSVELTADHVNRDELIDFAEKVIVCKNVFTPDSVSLAASVDALKLAGMFAAINIVQSDSGVTFLLTPAKYIADIRIVNAYPLFRDEVERALGIYPGDVLRTEEIQRQDSIVTALYQREGFIAPEVKLETELSAGSCDSIVTIRIKSGHYYRLRSIDIRGNRARSDFSIKRSMRSWRVSLMPGSAGRFIEAIYREDLKKGVEQYRKDGFADVVFHDTLLIDSVSGDVDAVVTIEEGDRYDIQCTRSCGRGLSRKVRQRAVEAFRNGNKNNSALRRSEKATALLLKNEGFLNSKTRVFDTTIIKRKYAKKIVTFDIETGARTTVSSIVINGVSAIDESVVRGQVLHTNKGSEKKRAFFPERLQEDAFAIEQLYTSSGFLQAKANVSSKENNNLVDVMVTIDEGTQTVVGSVTIDSLNSSHKEMLKVLTVVSGTPFRADRLKTDKRLLEAKLSEKGYPYVAVTPEVSMSSDSTKADIRYTITTGPLVTLGEIRYNGALRTKKRTLDREFNAIKEKPLSLADMIASQNNLRDMGIFSSVRLKTIGLREKRDTVHLVVEVNEKRPLHGVVGGGYETERKLYINAEAGDRNFLGLNKEIMAGVEASQIDEAIDKKTFKDLDGRVKFGLIDRRLLGLPLLSSNEIFVERTSERNVIGRSNNFGISTALSASASKHMLLGLGAKLERRRTLDNPKLSADEKAPRTLLLLTPTLTYDRRDSFTRPRKGVFFGASADFSKSLSSLVDNIVKVQVEAKSFLTPLSFLTIASVARGGYITPYGSTETIPADRLFYLGGTRNVRGFKDNLLDSSGGSVSLSATLEARITLGFNFELAAFTDAGRLGNELSSISVEQFRFSAGGGVRYLTPIGPIGLLYGRKINKKNDKDVGAFHFSIGYTF
ncbi:MAG: BamA/TamA family outer membrane protein [Chitinispirillaceae bacterium]|nr:BamA/TamA family outer membrane protein [Chitinispirillaceae bacterium]